MNFLESRFVKEMSDITDNMYHQGWDERNGGNISYMIDEKDIKEYFPAEKYSREFKLSFKADEMVRNKYFLVTGTGKYFKNVIKDPETNLGLVKTEKKHIYYGDLKMEENLLLNSLLI